MKKKSFLCGMLTMLLISTLVGTASARVGKVMQELEYRNISVSLDGEKLDLRDAQGNAVEPFMFEGTNYLPVRALAEALGLNVAWDGGTNTVVLTSDGAEQPNTSSGTEQPQENYSRTNPAPVGTTQTFIVSSSGNEHVVSMTVLDVFRGQTAWTPIREANRFNEEPPAGKEYILFAVSATVESSSSDTSINFDKYDFTFFSGSNAEYDFISTVDPEPEFSGSAYAGGTIEGFVSVLVDKTDENPKFVYGENRDGSGGIWFSLSNKA